MAHRKSDFEEETAPWHEYVVAGLWFIAFWVAVGLVVFA